MHFPLTRDCMQKVSSLARRTASSHIMIRTDARVCLLQKAPSPLTQEINSRKTEYSEIDCLIFRGASPYCPIQPVSHCVVVRLLTKVTPKIQ